MYYDFEPMGTFINVTEIYYNFEYSGADATPPSAHYLDFAPFATIDNSKTLLLLANTTQDTRRNLASFASAGALSARFDFHPIRPGVNILNIISSQSRSEKTLYVYSLELFIQYNYY